MSIDKQIGELEKAKKCNTCIHNAVCQELEEHLDSLGWISTKGEFFCSYYDNTGYCKASEVARDIFAEIETSLVIGGFVNGEKYIAIREDDYNHYKKKYTEEVE